MSTYFFLLIVVCTQVNTTTGFVRSFDDEAVDWGWAGLWAVSSVVLGIITYKSLVVYYGA